MSQNFDRLSMENARSLAQTPAGQKLISMLQSQDSQRLQAAMAQASSGDYEQLKKTLSVFMNSPEAQTLLKQLENHSNE